MLSIFEGTNAYARMNDVIDLAIVIVSYNVSELLRRCLQSIYDSEHTLKLAVCVVDNDSSDDSASMVRQEFPQANLIENKQNVGYPAANNQGMRALGVDHPDPLNRPRYVLLLNPDTEVPSETFPILVDYLDQQKDVGVLGPKLLLPDGSLDLACRRSFPSPEVSFYRMIGLSKIFPNSKRFGRYNLTYLDEDQFAEVDSVVGAFMMVRRTAIDRVGLMDERFWMYGEDLDWAKRIKDAGWRVVYYPEVSVLHVKRASSRQSKRARIEFYRAMLIFYYKYYHNNTPFYLHWLILLGVAIKGGRSIFPHLALGTDILSAG
jgi:GT2 family glycosyltransferase